MQYCKSCGAELPDQVRFCGSCGHPLNTTAARDEQEEEHRNILPDIAVPMMPAKGVPMVQGAPSTEGVPMVQGTPLASSPSTTAQPQTTPPPHVQPQTTQPSHMQPQTTPPPHMQPQTTPQPSDAVSYHTTPVAPSTRANVPPGVAVANRHITRRNMLIGLGLAGVTVVGGLGWWELSQRPTPIPLGTTLYTYRGHSNGVLSVAWSPDGKRIASGSGDVFNLQKDHTVQVWDAANGGNVFTYRGHSNWVYAVVWSPDGRRIASGGDTTVQV